MVSKPREIPKAMKASIREIPVTISAFSMGMLVIPMRMDRGIRFMLLMATAAAVPMITAIKDDKKAISRVLYKAVIMVELENSSEYHLVVKPPHWVRDLELLKDSTAMVAMGAYKNTRMMTR